MFNGIIVLSSFRSLAAICLKAITLFGMSVYSDEEIGPGVIVFNYSDTTVIEFFDGSRERIVHRISFSDLNDSIIPFMQQTHKTIEWLQPEFSNIFDADGYVLLFVLRVRSLSEDWVEVYIDNDYSTTLWIRNQPIMEFKSWESYLNEMLIIRLIQTPITLFEKPHNVSDSTVYHGTNCFRSIEIYGNWMKVVPYSDCQESLVLAKAPAQWIRWRRGKMLMIEYNPW